MNRFGKIVLQVHLKIQDLRHSEAGQDLVEYALLVTLIAISAVVICILAALIPAVNAARLAPARALRYE